MGSLALRYPRQLTTCALLALGKSACAVAAVSLAAGGGPLKPAGHGCAVYDYDRALSGQAVTSYDWSGPCIDGMASGAGELRAYLNGQLDETTRGNMIKGRLEGQAQTLFSDGARFEGRYANGQRNGFGRDLDTRGNFYEGGYANGQRQGYGVWRLPNGMRYEGDWANGKPSGEGEVIWPNGDHYKGLFVDGHYAKGFFFTGGTPSGR